MRRLVLLFLLCVGFVAAVPDLTVTRADDSPKELIPLSNDEVDTENREFQKRSNQESCQLCSECASLPQSSCKDLGGQICNAYQGGNGHGFTTNLIALVEIVSATNPNTFTAIMTQCLVANPDCPLPHKNYTLIINYPSLSGSLAACRDVLPKPGEYRLIAFSTFALVSGTTYTASTSVCYFNKLSSELTAYESGLLYNGGTGLNIAQACIPLVITEIARYDPSRQYFEVYNDSPVDTLNLGGLEIEENGVTVFTVAGSWLVGPQQFFLFTNDPSAFPTANSLDWTGSDVTPPFTHFSTNFGLTDTITINSPTYGVIDSVAQTTSFPIPTTDSEAISLNDNYNNNQIGPAYTPQYNYIQNDIASNWELCGAQTYDTTTCTPGSLNPSFAFAFGKRQTAPEVHTFRCVLQASQGSKYPQDLCRAHWFQALRDDITAQFPSTNFEAVYNKHNSALEAISKYTTSDVLVLGDPFITQLNTDELSAIYKFVHKHGGTLIANVNDGGQGALLLVDKLLQSTNFFSSTQASCEKSKSMKIIQDGFVARSTKPVQLFENMCFKGFSCNGGVSLVEDAQQSAKTALCYAEVGSGRVLFVTSWSPFHTGRMGLLAKADNKQLLLNFLESSFNY